MNYLPSILLLTGLTLVYTMNIKNKKAKILNLYYTYIKGYGHRVSLTIDELEEKLGTKYGLIAWLAMGSNLNKSKMSPHYVKDVSTKLVELFKNYDHRMVLLYGQTLGDTKFLFYFKSEEEYLLASL